jgi:hypothetical protein
MVFTCIISGEIVEDKVCVHKAHSWICSEQQIIFMFFYYGVTKEAFKHC